MSLQVVLARAAHDDRLAAARAPALGDRDRPLARQVLPGQRLGEPLELLRRPLADDPPAVEPRARTEVDHPVGRPDRLLVVLDHDDGVADVAHRDQRVDQLAVVALVEADRGFVEDVEHAHQLRADLRRELDALRLAARERRRAAGEVEVPDPDVVEEAQPVLDLLEDLSGDLPLARGQLQVLEEGDDVGDRLGGDLVDRAAAHPHRQGLRLQPAAGAGRARLGGHVRLELGPLFRVLGLAVSPLDHGDEPLEGRFPVVFALLRDVGELDLVVPGPIQDDLLRGLRELPEGRVEAELVVLGQGGHLPRPPVGRARLQDRDRAALDRPARVEHEALRIGLQVRAEARAGRAGAVGRVEREEARRDLRERGPAVRARVVGREDLLRPVGHGQDDEPVGDARRRLDRVGQALAVLLVVGRLGHEAVHDDLDRVLLLLVELGRIVEIHHLPVHAGAEEPLLDHLGHLLLVLALLAGDVGGEHDELAPEREPQSPVHHLLDGLRLDRPAALGAVGLADRGVEEPQVVVDLGDRADRRARVARGRALLDGDRRRESLDRVDVGLLHLLEELARVRRQRLDVAPLALRENRVEGERRFARARDSRDHDESVAGNVAGDVLEIVLPRAADPEEVHEGTDSNRVNFSVEMTCCSA